MSRSDSGSRRLDDAARAGWLYYVAGNNQEEVARKLNVSRQTAQRLVSLSVSEGLVKVRLDHPIGRCMELAAQLKDRYELGLVDVSPSDPDSQSTVIGIAQAAGAEMERRLLAPHPIVMAVGTGRSLKAAIDQMGRIEAPQHKVVSLAGNVAPDGSALFYNVIYSMADTVKARMFPMPLPVIAASEKERDTLLRQPMVKETLALAAKADVAFVGIGDLSESAPLYLDGFITREELSALKKAGAVGEIVGWAFDSQGELINGLTNARVANAPLPSRERALVVALAMGEKKFPGIRAALNNKLINGLMTDEATATRLLARR